MQVTPADIMRVRVRVGDCIRALDTVMKASTHQEAHVGIRAARSSLDEIEAALAPREAPVNKAETVDRTVEQGIRVFSLADGFQKWAGRDFETTLAAALKQWGVDDDEVLAQHARGAANREPEELEQPMDLDRSKFVNDAMGRTVSMRTALRMLIAAGVVFPCYIGGHEE